MNDPARLAAEEILARVSKLRRIAPQDPGGFRLPPRSDLRDIVERNLEIISEASRRLPDDLKAAHDEIDWRLLADLGNILRHVYHRIDETRLIEIMMDHLSGLDVAVQAILSELEAG